MDSFSLLVAFWQLGSAGMLLWGLAAALPILIHLWSRRKYRQEPWAAMTFLLAALRKNARRIQLEQWILLAVRTSLLALFAVALADPQFTRLASWAGGAAGGQSHVVLVIDGSYSMDYRVVGTVRVPSDGTRSVPTTSRFDVAKELAKELVRGGLQGDGYTLVLMGEPPRTVIGQPAFDEGDVLEELDNLEMPHAGASLPATLAEVETILRRAAERQPRLTQRRVVFFADLQQTTWNDVHGADARVRLARLEGLARLELIDLGQPGEQNLAVARLEIDQPLVAARSEVHIQADIQSYAREDRPRQAVEILINGQRIADERVDVPSGGRATVAVPYRFESPGEHVIEVRLADDALPLDNRRWLSVPVKDAIRVLAIGGRPGETRHLALAINPRPGVAGTIEVVEAPESRLVEGDLARFDCVILANIGRFSRDEAGVLHRYVSRGGGLIVLLGDQVQAESYNQLLADDPATRVLPARLQELATTATYRFSPLDYQHPVVAPFRGFEQAGLLTTPVWKYVRLAPSEGAKVALAFDSGDPAIVEQRIGRGRTILVATAASPDSVDRTADPPTPWTAIASWPSFPPLVHEMLRYAVGGRGEARNLLVGEDLTGSIPAAALGQQVILSGPDDLNERLPVVMDGGDARFSFSGTSTSGVYEARIGDSVQRYAVNVNPRESDLARLDPDLLPSQIRGSGVGGQETGESALPMATHHAPRTLFRWLLFGVLALLLVEPLLAWQFGRGRG
jgi:hypothetical protein